MHLPVSINDKLDLVNELVELKARAQQAAEGYGTGLDELAHEIAAAEAKVGAASAMNMGAGPSLAPVRSAPPAISFSKEELLLIFARVLPGWAPEAGRGEALHASSQ